MQFKSNDDLKTNWSDWLKSFRLVAVSAGSKRFTCRYWISWHDNLSAKKNLDQNRLRFGPVYFAQYIWAEYARKKRNPQIIHCCFNVFGRRSAVAQRRAASVRWHFANCRIVSEAGNVFTDSSRSSRSTEVWAKAELCDRSVHVEIELDPQILSGNSTQLSKGFANPAPNRRVVNRSG